ncbi:MAG: tetratricopeptide repeat protein 38 family protein [marine bacterium B5-7]|nr:MAG: tetratricopeptide repeat protein 38 family protein [marine bacterium B5-7]
MLEDRYGNKLSTMNQAARDAYVNAVDRLFAAADGVEEAFRSSIKADPDFALAYLGLARHYQMRGMGSLIAEPLAMARSAAAQSTTRESALIDAFGFLLEGKGNEAYRMLRTHLETWPRDAFAAQPCVGIFGLIGLSGRAGREAEQLAFTTAFLSHYRDDWWFLGQHAFAQIEAGQLQEATTNLEKSLAGNPRNANAAHFMAHLHYENGDTETGLDFLRDWIRDYSRKGLMYGHISWHIAVSAIELEDQETLFRIMNSDVSPGTSTSPSLNVISDTAAILFRAQLAGIEIEPERWQAVSDYALMHYPEPGLAFADVHAALAHSMVGNDEALTRIIDEARGPAADVVRALAESFRAMADERWADATRYLSIAMVDHARISGSRAQRDLIEFAMANVLLQQGNADEARRFLEIRRPRSTPSNAVKGLFVH